MHFVGLTSRKEATLTVGKSVSNVAANLNCNIKIFPMITQFLRAWILLWFENQKKVFGWIFFVCKQLNALFQFFKVASHSIFGNLYCPPCKRPIYRIHFSKCILKKKNQCNFKWYNFQNYTSMLLQMQWWYYLWNMHTRCFKVSSQMNNFQILLRFSRILHSWMPQIKKVFFTFSRYLTFIF